MKAEVLDETIKRWCLLLNRHPDNLCKSVHIEETCRITSVMLQQGILTQRDKHGLLLVPACQDGWIVVQDYIGVTSHACGQCHVVHNLVKVWSYKYYLEQEVVGGDELNNH